MAGAEFPVKAVLDDKGIEMLIAALTKAGKEAGKTDKEIAEMNAELRKTGTEGVKSVNNINNSLDNFTKTSLKRVGGAIIAAFAVERLLAFGKSVIDITAEFQKFQAVLTNTLGSKSQAQIALQQIQKFAAQTPFSVKELTDSFVRLANQGFVPTTNELRKLGDLASSTGKGFDQLTEAIIDAQTGEFERLKEFGIRANKEGDKVKFTFKGVQTQTEFTSQAIREYVLSLGDMAGVSGSMAAISETLGGRISNLGDAWDTFLKTVGDGSNGVLSSTVTLLSEAVTKATELLKTDEQRAQDTASIILDKYKLLDGEIRKEEFKNKIYEEQFKLTVKKAEAEKGLRDAMENRDVDSARLYREDIEGFKTRLETVKQSIAFIAGYEQSLIDQADAQTKAADAADKERAAQLALAAAKKKAKEQADLLAQIERDAAALDAKQETVDGKSPFFINYADEIEADTDAALNAMKERDDALFNQFLENEERLRQAAETDAEQKLETKAYVRDALIGLSNEVFEFEQAKLAAQSQQIEEQRKYELELAGNNADAKTAINKKFDEEQSRIKTKQAQSDKDQAIFNILLSTGQGIVAALASVPPNVPLSVAIGITGGIQAGLAASRKIPKFANGVFDLEGPGTTTSDSINAMLSKGESVVPAKQTNAFGWLLKPMIEDNLDLLELKQLVDSRVPSHLRGDIMRPAAATDSNELVREMRETRKAIENKKETHIDIDENGFNKWTRQGQLWTEYKTKRYRS